jgi:polyisoprenoid-binding protein YceI
MKTRFLTVLTLAILAVAFTNCKDTAKEAETTEAVAPTEKTDISTKYKVNTEGSTIMWTGHKPTGKHNGTIAIESGVMTMKDNVLESGTFLINMNSINVMDIPVEEKGHAKLTNHLKSDDFFDVAQYPTSAFEVTGIETVDGKTMLSGNLNMKNVTNNVTIPVTINQNGDMLVITSETFTIDRSKWDVKYGSKSFFDNLGDKFIDNDIELKINVSAIKA